LLRRNIGETNGASFRGASNLEVAIWNECARLVANSVMYYNASLLSKVMSLKEVKGGAGAAEFIQHLSPIASQHLNFSGRYEFNKESEPLDLDKIVKMMDKIEIKIGKKKK